jgi:hypothetical protein
MPDTDSLSPEVKEQIEKIGSADVVVGLPAYKTKADLSWAANIARSGLNVLIAYPDNGEAEDLEQFPGASLMRYPLSASERYLNAPTTIFGSFHEVFQISQKLAAKSVYVWNTNPQHVSMETVEQMLRPVLEQQFDLVMPRYIEVKLGTLINSSVISPMTRALYGRRIQFPMAIDLCFSGQFVSRLLQSDPYTHRPRSQQWIAAEAICGNLRVCQVNVPMEPPRPPDSTDLSSILTMVLGRLFLDLERNATFWQRSNASQNVATFGTPERKEDEVAVDVQPMIETFQLGYRNLTEIWGVALPPATLLELKRLTKLVPGAFRMADDLWVRIVYDFALAHRQRAINREHLLRAMTPLYLAWVASYALEIQGASNTSFQGGLERLALAYEKQKPYLLSRWRWPDRFNP